MARFDDVFPFTMAAEGGAVDNPDDPGGDTGIGGITAPVWAAYLKQTNQKYRPLSTISKTDEHDLYLSLFWKPYRLDEVCTEWAVVVFDAAVNLVPGASVRLAQAALIYAEVVADDFLIDGAIGDVTIDAMNANPQVALSGVVARLGYHVARTLPEFLKGSVNRVAHERDFVTHQFAQAETPGESVTESGQQHIVFPNGD